MQQALEGTAGVSKVVMRFDDGEYDVTFDPATTSADALAAVVMGVNKEFKATAK